MNKTIYVSLDVECDGADIITNSCIQLALVAGFESAGEFTIIKEYSTSIEKLSGTNIDTATLNDFWYANEDNKSIYEQIKKSERKIELVAQEIYDFLAELNKIYNVKIVARPTSYDVAWLRKVLSDGNQDPKFVSHTCICISTMLTCADYLGVDRKTLNSHIRTESLQHTHNALDDAKEQLHMFFQLKRFYQANF